MLSISVTAPGTVGTVGTPVSMVGFQLGAGLTAQLPGTASASDGVQFYGANISNATSLSQLSQYPNLVVGPGTPESSGLAPSQPGSGLSYLYLYAVRTVVATAGAVVATVTGQETTGTNGGSSNPNAILQGGNAFGAPIVIGSTDVQPLTLMANNVTGYAQVVSGSLTLGTSTVSSTTTVQSGAGGTVNLGTGVTAVTVNLGTGAAAKTVGVGSSNTTSTTTVLCGSGGLGLGTAAPGASGVAIDTPAGGSITIGFVAVSVAIGGTASQVASITANVQTGGTINIANGVANQTVNIGTGGGVIATTIGSSSSTSSTVVQAGTGGLTVATAATGNITITAGTTGMVVVNSGTTGDVNLGTGAAGVDANAKTVRLGTGAAAKVILIGSATGASSAQILVGSGGLGLGVAAPGGGGVTLDTPAAGTVLVGTTNATTVTVGNQTGATAASLLGGTGGISIGVPSSAAAGVNITGGTGTSSFSVGAAGTLNLATAAVAATVNLGTGAAAQTVTIGSTNTTSTTAINAGTGGVKLTATGAGNVTLVPGATGNVQLNGAAAVTCGVQLGIPVAVTNVAGGGTIGANTITVDVASVIEVNQTTAGQTLTVPNPTITTQARLLYIINIGSVDFTLLASTVKAIGAGSKSMTCLIWSPGATRWVPTVIT